MCKATAKEWCSQNVLLRLIAEVDAEGQPIEAPGFDDLSTAQALLLRAREHSVFSVLLVVEYLKKGFSRKTVLIQLRTILGMVQEEAHPKFTVVVNVM